MAIATVANIVVPAATVQASTANVLNYIGSDGSMTSSGSLTIGGVFTFPPSQYVFNGSYYDELIIQSWSGAQTGSTTPVLDFYTILSPNTVLSGSMPISGAAASSPLRHTLSNSGGTTNLTSTLRSSPISGIIKDSLIYPFFVITFFSSTTVTAGGLIQINIQGLLTGRTTGTANF